MRIPEGLRRLFPDFKRGKSVPRTELTTPETLKITQREHPQIVEYLIELPEGAQIIIGSDQSATHITIPEGRTGVSPRHVAIGMRDGELVIKDLGVNQTIIENRLTTEGKHQSQHNIVVAPGTEQILHGGEYIRLSDTQNGVVIFVAKVLDGNLKIVKVSVLAPTFKMRTPLPTVNKWTGQPIRSTS